MGWASGSYLAEEIWVKIKPFIPEENKIKVAKIMYDSFCNYDADDWSGEEGSLENLAEQG